MGFEPVKRALSGCEPWRAECGPAPALLATWCGARLVRSRQLLKASCVIEGKLEYVLTIRLSLTGSVCLRCDVSED